jgi:hypothetical protein
MRMHSAMVKQMIWAVLAIFVAWLALDFLLHRLLLRSAYEAASNLWRPFDQMNIPLIYFVRLTLITSFVLIYGVLIEQKSLTSGIKFGVLFGLAISISSGFGTYIHMPIPLKLAWSWFLGGWFKMITAGGIVGMLIKQRP